MHIYRITSIEIDILKSSLVRFHSLHQSILHFSVLILDDRNRVCLSRILGHPYINASFIEVRFSSSRSSHCRLFFLQGYSRKCSFIITQDPLLETAHEFWRMFIEHDSNCIVQLHTINDVSVRCFPFRKKTNNNNDDDFSSPHLNVRCIIRMIWNRR